MTELVSTDFLFGVLSMALDSQDEPHLLYSPGFTNELHYVARSGGVWTDERVATEHAVGYWNALVLDVDDRLHIAFASDTGMYYGRPPVTTGVDGTPWHGGGTGLERAVRIWPNPSSAGPVTIELRSESDGPGFATRGRSHRIEAQVLDASGRLVTRFALGGGTPVTAVTWDVRDATGRIAGPGVYFVRFAAGGVSVATGRVTILREGG
jgi:hypothetical protein